MSRIATLTAVLCLAAAPAAFADGPAFHGNVNDIGKQSAPAVVDLRSPDAVAPMQVAGQDLRSPDAIDTFRSPVATTSPDPSGGFNWGILGIVAAALAACAGLAVMVRRLTVGRPVGV
jgi:hypothetical protein